MAEDAPTAQLLSERRKTYGAAGLQEEPESKTQKVFKESIQRADRILLDDALNRIGCGYFQDRLWWVCGFGFTAAAIEVVLMAFLLPSVKDAWKLTEMQLGIIPMSVSAGSTLGKVGCSAIADHFGRRWIFCTSSLMVAVFGVASALSPNIYWLCACRFLVGLGFGGNIAVDFAMFAEFLPTASRNNKLFLMQVLWPVGQVFTCIFAWLTIPRLGSNHGWRAFVLLCAAPSVVSACLRAFVPESPRWLVTTGREAEATMICREIATANGKSPEAVGLHAGVLVSSTSEPVNPRTLAERRRKQHITHRVFRLLSPELYRTTLGLFMFSMALSTTGYAMNTLLPTLLLRKGIPAMEMNFTMTLTAVCEIPAVLGAMVIAGLVGRLLPLRAAMVSTAGAIALLANAKDEYAVIPASCIGAMCLEASWALYHVYVPEVYPTELRATAGGVIEAASSVMIFWVPLVSAYILETMSTLHVVLFFSAACASGAIGACCWLHVETQNRDLRDF